MASLPHVVSRVNGMKIPLLPGQAGIMHRFRNPENQLVIEKASEHGRIDSDERLVIPATQENEVAVAPSRARKSKTPDSEGPTLGEDAPKAAVL